MAKIVDILPTSDQLKCVAGQSCAVDFSFTNTTGRRIRVGGKILPGDQVLERWFNPPEGGAERDLDPNTTEKLTFKAQIPVDAKPGTYTMQVMLFDVKQPEDYFDLSPTVRIEIGAASEVPKKEGPKPFPWWILAVVFGVLLVAGVATWLFLRNGDVTVPDVAGLSSGPARSELEKASLAVSQVTEVSSAPVDQVLRTDPAAGTEVKKDSRVVMFVAGPAAKVDVPNLVKVPADEAERILGSLGLKAVRRQPPKATLEFATGQVVTHTPAMGNKVDPGTTVELEVAGDSVKVPRVKGLPLPAAMQAMANLQLFVEVTGDQNKLQEAVVGTSPPEDTVVLRRSKVQVQMPGIRVLIPFPVIQANPLFINKMKIMREVMPEGEPENR